MHAPAIEAHRLLGDGRSAALLLPDATIDWWCAPGFDSPPLLWWLLDVDGAVARWCGARMVRRDGRPAGPTARTTIIVRGQQVECWDGMVAGTGGRGSCLVRLVRAVSNPVPVEHELRLAGLDSPPALWAGPTTTVGGMAVAVTGGRSTSAGGWLRTQVDAVPDRWNGFAVAVDGDAPAGAEEMTAALAAAEADLERLIDGCRLPRHHPERARDALLVLNTCTYRPTGAVIASPTTSLPEVVGGRSQWDYRYTWLRDASLAVSVAALLGRRDAAERYLGFVHDMAKGRQVPSGPFTDIRGESVPDERDLKAAGWAGSQPVRVGNGARDQVQYDGLGLFLKSVSVYLQTGGSLDQATWDLVRSTADELAGDVDRVTNGIWELRDPLPLVDGDIGRWLALDVALWIARLRHPLTRRRHWKIARDAARDRVLEAIRADGGLPQAYEGGARSDASALMIPVFALLGRGDVRAHRLVDAVRRDLGGWPFLYRFPPDQPVGREGAFLPISWWAVTALAVLGRYHEARDLADEMCARLPSPGRGDRPRKRPQPGQHAARVVAHGSRPSHVRPRRRPHPPPLGPGRAGRLASDPLRSAPLVPPPRHRRAGAPMTTSQRRGVAVVTGGTAGVGRAVVRRLAEEGFDVAILARGEAGLAGAAEDVRERGRRAVAETVDVADAAAVEAAASRVEAELGPIDVWVNNAMTTVFAWSWDVEPEEYRRATEVTYLGQVYGTLAALRRMRPRNRGRIVNVGSSLAYIGIPLQAAYCASKFAARGFTESVRAELVHQGSDVTLSMVHLPAVDTPQFDWCEARLPNHPQPVAPTYSPEVAAEHVVDAVFDGRRSKMLGAWNKLIFTGIKVAPAVLAHFAARTSVDAQQTGQPVEADRPSNLWNPVDAERDYGASGSFGDQHGGFLNPKFLATLPKTALDVAVAVADATRFRLQRRTRTRQLARHKPTNSATHHG